MQSRHSSWDRSLRCAVCGSLLTDGYYYLRHRPERYCEACMLGGPHCDSCGAPAGDDAWRLHDGRIQCARCHTTAIYDAQEAKRIYEETVAAIGSQLSLHVTLPVSFRLVDAPTLRQIRANHGIHRDETVLGLFRLDGQLRVIYMLYGLPRMMFRTTVAHEFAHAWQSEYCPTLGDEPLREGFAEWVAYRHLLYLGSSKAAQQLLESEHPYRPYLEAMLELEKRGGPAAVIRRMLQG